LQKLAIGMASPGQNLKDKGMTDNKPTEDEIGPRDENRAKRRDLERHTAPGGTRPNQDRRGLHGDTDHHGLFGRMFDEHSDGRFVKTLLISMLLIATVVQPFSLIYTAYGENLPNHWWAWTPALAMLLFLALDWTILPLAYFFATTGKISLKIVLGVMIGIVLFGAFEGYFTATERLIQMRLQGITKQRLELEQAQQEVDGLNGALNEAKSQNETDSKELTTQRDELTTEISKIDGQIDTAQKMLAQAEADYQTVMERCLRIQDVCLKPERARHDHLTNDLGNQIGALQKSKELLNEKLAILRGKSDEKVVAANADLKASNKELNDKRKIFNAAVLDSQVYRWTGALLERFPSELNRGFPWPAERWSLGM
jgi:hypothetical protein